MATGGLGFGDESMSAQLSECAGRRKELRGRRVKKSAILKTPEGEFLVGRGPLGTENK